MIFRMLLHIKRHLDEYEIAGANILAFMTISFYEITKFIEMLGQVALIMATLVFTILKSLEVQERRKREKRKEKDKDQDDDKD